MDKIRKIKRGIIGEILRAERNYRCIEQNELARKLNKTQACISKTESGRRKVDIIELIEYCYAMGITLTELSIKIDSRFSHEFPDEYVSFRKSLLSRKLTFLQKVGEVLSVMG